MDLGSTVVDIPPEDNSQLGPITIDLDGRPVGMQEPSYHNENLAEIMEDHEIALIGMKLADAIEEDIESREEWESALKDGLLQLGIKPEEKEFPFPGATGIYSSKLMQQVMTFIANAQAELLPADGPVHVKFNDSQDSDVEEKAYRIKDFMNFYLTEVSEEFYPDMESALLWCVLYGSVFKKTYFDHVQNRPVSPYIQPEDFVVNYGVASLSTALRITHILRITDKELRLKQQVGFYADIKLTPFDDDEDDKVRGVIDDLLGMSKSASSVEYNTKYELFECHCDLTIEDEESGISRPYVVTLDRESKKVLSVYRNWREGDNSFKRIECFTQYSFMPGLGFYGYGLLHLVGGCATAATMLTRQLIDAGMLANFPGGLRAKGANVEQNNIRVGPTEFVEIDTGGLPIDQSIMMMPYKDPSAILLQLKDQMEDNISQFGSIVNQQTSDFNPNAPVGTTLALLENSGRLESSVIRRLHRSMKKELKLIYNLFAEHFGNTPYPVSFGSDDHPLIGSDFQENFQIVPVSDPNLSSKTHRLILNEALLKFAQQNPELHDMRNIYERIYRDMKIPDVEKILLPVHQDVPPPAPLDPITENKNLINGTPVVAGIWQDHAAHIAVHNMLLQDQSLQEKQQTIQAHVQEHQAMQFQLMMQQQMGFELPEDPTQLAPEQQNQIAMAAYQVALNTQQQQQQAEPPAPIDPSIPMLEDVKVKLKGIEERSRAEDIKMQLEMERISLEREKMQMDFDYKLKQLNDRNENDSLRTQIEQYKAALQGYKIEKEDSKNNPMIPNNLEHFE